MEIGGELCRARWCGLIESAAGSRAGGWNRCVFFTSQRGLVTWMSRGGARAASVYSMTCVKCGSDRLVFGAHQDACRPCNGAGKQASRARSFEGKWLALLPSLLLPDSFPNPRRVRRHPYLPSALLLHHSTLPHNLRREGIVAPREQHGLIVTRLQHITLSPSFFACQGLNPFFVFVSAFGPSILHGRNLCVRTNPDMGREIYTVCACLDPPSLQSEKKWRSGVMGDGYR